MKRVNKGDKGYIDYMKVLVGIKTLVLFAISGLIFAAGLIHSGKKENILTVVAVLGVLPACRSLVTLIMFLRFKSFKGSEADRIAALTMADYLKPLCFFDSVLTMEKGGSYQVDAFICVNNSLIGYTSHSSADIPLVEKHLRAMLKNNGLKKVGVKLFNNIDAYISRADELRAMAMAYTPKLVEAAFDDNSAASNSLCETIKQDYETIALIGALSL